MRVQRGFKCKGAPHVKVSCSNLLSEAEWDRIVKIAKKQGWTQADMGRYIISAGFETLVTSFLSCGEEYDDDGNQIPEDA